MREERSNISKLFSPFSTRTEQCVNVKRGNESEWTFALKLKFE